MVALDDSSKRRYAVVVWGATGFTGKLCCEHLSHHYPTDLSWAIAGRSQEKLAAVAKVSSSLG
jgi:short subunit dehydrogenase-like uncharacterized protein